MSIETLTIKEIYPNYNRKDGTAYVNPYNKKPSVLLGLKFNEKGEERFSLFLDVDKFRELNWQVGYQVKLLLEQNGQYWNAKLPGKLDIVANEVDQIKQWIRRHDASPQSKAVAKAITPPPTPATEEEISDLFPSSDDEIPI